MIRTIAWLGLHHGVGRGLTFGFFLLLPAVLPLDQVGIFTLWFTVVVVVAQPMLEMPLELSLTTHAASGQFGNARALIAVVVRWLPGAGLLAWVVGWSVGAPPLLLGLLIANLLLARTQAGVFALNRGLERPRMEGLIGAGQRLVSLVLLGVMVAEFGGRAEVPAAALFGGHVVGWLLMVALFSGDRQRLRGLLDTARGQDRSGARLLVQGFELAAIAVVSSLYLRVDVLVVGWFAGNAEAGAYFTSARTLDAGAGVAHLIMLAALPRLVRSEAFVGFFLRLLMGMFFLGCVVGGILWIGAPAVLSRLYGDGAGTIPIIAGHFGLVVPVVFAGYVATQGLAVLNRRRLWLALAVIGLICNLGLDVWLVPTMGGLGAMWATLCAELIVAFGATAACLAGSLHRERA